jgi:uncharacterized C2H2 Zn-finger protein
MNDETCPKCGAHFPADRAWAKRTVGMLFVSPALQDLDTRVKCPACSTVFDAREFRFFGFVSPKAMRVGVFGFIGVMLILAVSFVFSAP